LVIKQNGKLFDTLCRFNFNQFFSIGSSYLILKDGKPSAVANTLELLTQAGCMKPRSGGMC
jgi:hypothetical protein